MINEHGFRPQCSFHDIHYDNYRETGLSTKIKFECDICGFLEWVHLDKDETKTMPLNQSAVVGTIATGTGYTELKQQLGAMAIKCMSSKSYRQYRQDLVASFDKAAEESMKEAAEM